MVFLVRNEIGLLIQLETGGTKMITELVTDELRGNTSFVALRASLDQRQPLFVIHHVHRLTIKDWPIGIPSPKDLDPAQVDPLLDKRTAVLLHPLADTLTGRVVDVIGLHRALSDMLQLILEVPVHGLEMVHPGDTSMVIVGIGR